MTDRLVDGRRMFLIYYRGKAMKAKKVLLVSITFTFSRTQKFQCRVSVAIGLELYMTLYVFFLNVFNKCLVISRNSRVHLGQWCQ